MTHDWSSVLLGSFGKLHLAGNTDDQHLQPTGALADQDRCVQHLALSHVDAYSPVGARGQSASVVRIYSS